MVPLEEPHKGTYFGHMDPSGLTCQDVHPSTGCCKCMLAAHVGGREDLPEMQILCVDSL